MTIAEKLKNKGVDAAKKPLKTPLEELLNRVKTKVMQDGEDSLKTQNKAIKEGREKNRTSKCYKPLERRYFREKEIIKEYQFNIKEAEILKSETLKSLLAGREKTEIILTLAKIVGYNTNDKLFYKQVKDYIINIYGEALNDKNALKIHLNDLEERLSTLKSKYKQNNLKDLKRAILEHEAERDRILSLIAASDADKAINRA